MKKFLISLFACIMSLAGNSQSYEPVSYQVVVRSPEGQVISNQKVSLKFSIFMGNPFDTIVYVETHHVVTSNLGLASAVLGNGTRNLGDFTSIELSQDKYFMKVEIDTAGGINFSDMGTIQILIIPYMTSAKPSKKSKETLSEEQMIISRRYIGKFIEYRQTGPNQFNGPNLIWIKTTMESSFGKISAFGKKCAFSPGDNLYLKRSYLSPGGVFGYWDYRIENDSSVNYRVSDYQYDRKILVETWFK